MLSASEIQSINSLWPHLKFVKEEKKLKGKIKINAFYNKATKEFIINPNPEKYSKTDIIIDEYTVEIKLPDDYPQALPLVRETGNRVQKITEQKQIEDKRDLHINTSDNTICCCVKPKQRLLFPNGVDIIRFLQELVIPYFYGLSYYEKYNKWPLGQYSHGDIGMIEFYLEEKDVLDIESIKDCVDALSPKTKSLLTRKGKVKGKWPCICQSSLPFQRCHKKLLKGLRLLKNAYIRAVQIGGD